MSLSLTQNNSFSSLNMQDLVDKMGLTKKKPHPKNSNLLQISDLQKNQINPLIALFEDKIDYFNESELTVKYISKIIDIIGFETDNYATFIERSISATVQNYKLCGDVDMMIASGFYEPKSPYFFLQEFKKAKNPSGDPLPQLLGEMLVAQELNKSSLVYGAYIVGRFWTFVSLNDLIFTEDKPLDSANNLDLEIILNKLNWIKEYIEKELQIVN